MINVLITLIITLNRKRLDIEKYIQISKLLMLEKTVKLTTQSQIKKTT